MQSFTFHNDIAELDSDFQHLIDHASAALRNAYAPYSHFHVAAALLLEDGTVITGTNQENAAYPSGMCAERVALFAKASRHPDLAILKMAVVARPQMGASLVPATSCGPCRQVMLEFEHRQHNPFQVAMLTEDQQWVVAATAQSLLPFCFSAKNLGNSGK
jgi:cytidine deaminase